MNSRRQNSVIKERKVADASHAGLWLDKFITELGSETTESKEARAKLVNEVSSIKVSSAYEPFFKERWKPNLALICGANNLRTATVGTKLEHQIVPGRLSIGLGNASVLETSIQLHRTYGVPMIPGSALKGLCSSFAHQRLDATWRKAGKDEAGKELPIGEQQKVLFGDTSSAGYVTFFDALYIPNSAVDAKGQKLESPLVTDTITVHHSAYYQGGDQLAPPADWDDPNPVPFLSCTGSFLIGLAGPQDWTQAAFEILEQALSEFGVGAKTSSGYGRMVLSGVAV
jgi:CRISPR-associated protein Cmr6